MTRRPRGAVSGGSPGAATLFGRTRDLREIRRLLRAGPATVVGPPGVGKTAAASAIARARGGVLCHLAGVADTEALLAAVGMEIGQPAASPEPVEVRLELIASAVRERRIGLLVLDNADGLIPGGIDALARLAAQLAGVQLLATAREPLGLPGERVYRLGPLRPAEAASLFETRAREAGGGRIHARDTPAVRALVRRLDGVPLAVEFAAGLARQFTPRGMLRAFRDEAWSARVDARAHHDGVLLRSFTLSWERLSPAEQRALRECAVFEDGFTGDDAAAVLDHAPGEPPARELVESLARKSLIAVALRAPRLEPPVPLPTEEFRLLATVKNLVRRFSPPGFDGERTQARHAERLLARFSARPYDPTRDLQPDERAELRRLQPDAVAAIEWLQRARPADAALLALRVCQVLELGGPHDLQFRLLERAVGWADGLPPLEHTAVLTCRATVLRWNSRLPEAESAARDAVAVAEASDDHRARALANLTLADMLNWRGARDEALVRVDTAIAHAARAGDRALEGVARPLASVLCRMRRDNAAAEDHAVRALALCEGQGSSWGTGAALLALGTLRMEDGRFDEAAGLFTRARELFSATFDRRRETRVLNFLASLELARGNDERALAYLREASRWRKLLDTGPVAPFVRLNLALLLQRGEYLAEARRELDEAIAGFRARGQSEHLAIAVGVLAAQHADSGDVAAAETAMSEAERTLPPGAKRGRPDLELLRGIVRCARSRDARVAGRDEEARADLDAARAALVHASAGAEGLPAHPVIRKLLERALERSAAPFASMRITVAGDGGWFVSPDGVRHGLATRRVLRNLLVALVRAHRRSPLGVSELKAAGWPGERMLSKAASNRVWVAISTLRGMGLAGVILRAEQGYLIAPHVDIETVIHAPPDLRPARARPARARPVRHPKG